MYKNAISIPEELLARINISDKLNVGNKMVECIFDGHCFTKIKAEKSIQRELSSYFTFTVPNYQMLRRMMMKKNPKFFYWDGKVKLYDGRGNRLPLGLLKELYVFCKDRKYKLILPKEILNSKNKITEKKAKEYVDGLNLTLTPRDYQFNAFYKAINDKRITIVSPTASGKSLSMAMFTKWCYDHTKGKVLLIVPTKQLVRQFRKNYEEYGLKEDIHEIMAGMSKDSGERIYVSTWQSLYKEDEKYFEKFETIIGDEIHHIRNPNDGKAVLSLFSKTKNAHYRMGTTGTLRDCAINKLQITGMFGGVFNVSTTKELMERGILSKLKIRTIKIEYPYNVSNEIGRLEWDSQQEFIESEENPRQQLIWELANSLKHNTLILFRKITHGTYIYEQLLGNTGKKVHYIDGKVKVDDREDIRKTMENNDGHILVASYGTLSTGIDIKNLHNIIFASSSKSKIRIMQSIGRSLRLHNKKSNAVLYDIVDCIGYFEAHFNSRKDLYDREKLPYKEKNVNISTWCKKRGVDFF